MSLDCTWVEQRFSAAIMITEIKGALSPEHFWKHVPRRLKALILPLSQLAALKRCSTQNRTTWDRSSPHGMFIIFNY